MTTRAHDALIGFFAIVAFLLLLAQNTAFGDAHPQVFSLLDTVVLSLFACDVLGRFLTAADRKAHLQQHWLDCVVFLPFALVLISVRVPVLDVLIRQCVIVAMLLSRSRKAAKFLALLSLRPAQVMAAGFLSVIGIGTVLLMLPGATVSGERTPLIDALFTSTSAVCVTGLVVRDTATHFSRFGQLIILALIQVGGLGIMTASVSMAVFTVKAMDVKQQASLQDALDHDTLGDIVRMLRFIVRMTFVLEALGAALLFLAWRDAFGSAGQAAFHAGFHAVSAFCNAGFSTFSDSLTGFRGDVAVNLIIILLIIAGGLGFLVVRDVLHGFCACFDRKRRPAARTRLQTKIALAMTALLILGGTALFYLAERQAGLAAAAPRERLLTALFHAVTPRTAGFNTVDVGRLTPAALWLTLGLMFIGGSPGSTAGGIKTTTVATLWAALKGLFQNRLHAELFRRTLPRENVRKAAAVLVLALAIVFGFAFTLMLTEAQPFLDILFETVSAFGTVGLSTGITPALSAAGKVQLVVLMYVGRLGPFTLAYAFYRRRRPALYEYADERVMIG